MFNFKYSFFCRIVNTDEVEKGSVLEQQMEHCDMPRKKGRSINEVIAKPKVTAATAGFQRLHSDHSKISNILLSLIDEGVSLMICILLQKNVI